MQFLCRSEAETVALGYRLAERLPLNSVVCLFGDLGAGKTTFVKGVAAYAAGCKQANSPTFVYLNIYEGRNTVYHFDLYRLVDTDEFLNMGFEEMFYAGGICCIEWSERIASILPPDAIRVTLSHTSEGFRTIEITPWD